MASEMDLDFEWDKDKAAANLKKHKVSFEEAKTVFADPFAITIDDPKHSVGEQRFIDTGTSADGKILVVFLIPNANGKFGLSVAVKPLKRSVKYMKKDNKTKKPQDQENDEMLPEYDFSGGVRGKHHKAYRRGHTVTINKTDGTKQVQHFTLEEGVVMLEPNVREYFPDSESVNEALRGLITLLPGKSKRRVRP